MLSVYHFVDALPAAVAGMVALWAAGSAWHWFIRTSVILAGLLAMLLIPAYELVITFGAEMLMVVVGMRIWLQQRNRRDRAHRTLSELRQKARLSLKSLMLLTVVVAVFVAVVAKFPTLNWYVWMSRTGSGLIAGMITLLCAWLVLGDTRRWIRFIAAFLIWSGAAFAISFCEILGYAIWYWTNGSTNIVTYMLKPASKAWVFDRTVHWVWTLAIAMPILCAWIHLWVRSGWYSPFAESAEQTVLVSSSSRRVGWVRGGLVAVSVATIGFPFYLYWLLLTPPPYRVERSLMPSGYLELIQASELIEDSRATGLRQHSQMSSEELSAELAALEPAFLQMQLAFSHSPEYVQRRINDEKQGAANLIYVIAAQMDLANRKGLSELKLEASLNFLRLMDFFTRDSTPDTALLFVSTQEDAIRTLWECRQQLSGAQTKELAIALGELDRRHVSWKSVEEHLKRSHQNAGWEWHLQSLLNDWTGYDQFANNRLEYQSNIAQMRVLIGDLAIQAFRHEQGRLPSRLDELVPGYLFGVPIDPFTEVPLIYRIENDSFMLYSVGRNLQDDGGKTFDAHTNNGDIVAKHLFPPSPIGKAVNMTAPKSGSTQTANGDKFFDSLDADPKGK